MRPDGRVEVDGGISTDDNEKLFISFSLIVVCRNRPPTSNPAPLPLSSICTGFQVSLSDAAAPLAITDKKGITALSFLLIVDYKCL